MSHGKWSFSRNNDKYPYANGNFCQNSGYNSIFNFEASIPNDISFSNPPTEIWMRLIIGDTNIIVPIPYNSIICWNPFPTEDIKDLQSLLNGTSSEWYRDCHLKHPNYNSKEGNKKETIVNISRFEYDRGSYNMFFRL